MNQPLFSSPEPYENLLNAAETAFAEGQAKESVILAQTAVELFTEKILGELDVEFLGFETAGKTEARSLAEWAAWEQAEPDTFSAMYQFWIRR